MPWSCGHGPLRILPSCAKLRTIRNFVRLFGKPIWRITGRAFGLGLSGLFLLISILIIFNTVRIAIFIHREEIAVMRLVGAAGWFIRAPYFIEAVLLSAVATVLAAAVVFPVLLLLQPKLDLFFASTPAKILPYFLENGWTIFGLEFVGLALVSVLSAAFAMRRHLRV